MRDQTFQVVQLPQKLFGRYKELLLILGGGSPVQHERRHPLPLADNGNTFPGKTDIRCADVDSNRFLPKQLQVCQGLWIDQEGLGDGKTGDSLTGNPISVHAEHLVSIKLYTGLRGIHVVSRFAHGILDPIDLLKKRGRVADGEGLRISLHSGSAGEIMFALYGREAHVGGLPEAAGQEDLASYILPLPGVHSFNGKWAVIIAAGLGCFLGAEKTASEGISPSGNLHGKPGVHVGSGQDTLAVAKPELHRL